MPTGSLPQFLLAPPSLAGYFPAQGVSILDHFAVDQNTGDDVTVDQNGTGSSGTFAVDFNASVAWHWGDFDSPAGGAFAWLNDKSITYHVHLEGTYANGVFTVSQFAYHDHGTASGSWNAQFTSDALSFTDDQQYGETWTSDASGTVAGGVFNYTGYAFDDTGSTSHHSHKVATSPYATTTDDTTFTSGFVTHDAGSGTSGTYSHDEWQNDSGSHDYAPRSGGYPYHSSWSNVNSSHDTGPLALDGYTPAGEYLLSLVPDLTWNSDRADATEFHWHATGVDTTSLHEVGTRAGDAVALSSFSYSQVNDATSHRVEKSHTDDNSTDPYYGSTTSSSDDVTRDESAAAHYQWSGQGNWLSDQLTLTAFAVDESGTFGFNDTGSGTYGFHGNNGGGEWVDLATSSARATSGGLSATSHEQGNFSNGRLVVTNYAQGVNATYSHAFDMTGTRNGQPDDTHSTDSGSDGGSRAGSDPVGAPTPDGELGIGQAAERLSSSAGVGTIDYFPIGITLPVSQIKVPKSLPKTVYNQIVQYFGKRAEQVVVKLGLKENILVDFGNTQNSGSPFKKAEGEFEMKAAAIAIGQGKFEDIDKAEKKAIAELDKLGYKNIKTKFKARINWHVVNPEKNPRSGTMNYDVSIFLNVTATLAGVNYDQDVRIYILSGSFFDANLITTDVRR